MTLPAGTLIGIPKQSSEVAFYHILLRLKRGAVSNFSEASEEHMRDISKYYFDQGFTIKLVITNIPEPEEPFHGYTYLKSNAKSYRGYLYGSTRCVL